MKNAMLCLVIATVGLAYADESTEQLRQEFEARIAALETQSAADSSAPGRETLDFEFHGYFRAGLGANGNGDAMESFKAPNAGAKYRLGNEAETYIEASFQQNFRTQALIDNNVDFYTKLTFAYVTPTTDNNAFDTTTSLREAYAGARGVWDAKKEAMFWAGNRFYEHLDIHINDFFFRDMAGFGGGIEDVELGDEMKWAFAWLGGSIDELDSDGTTYQNNYHFNKNTFDFRLYDIPVGIGTLALSLDLADFAGDQLDDGAGNTITIEDSLGWAAGAILKSDLTDEMANRFTIQYGAGAADNFRAVITAPQGVAIDTNINRIATDDTMRLRITDDIVIDNGSPLSLQAAAIYERYDNGFDTMNTIDWVSIGARPVYHFNDFFSLAFEAGADYTNQKGGPEGVVGKFTLAPQIQPAAKHFSRPSIRAFLTYATWSDGFEGMVAPVGYGNETQGISAGVQMEAWW
ncbi:Maltoporin [Pontiella desulfatans]|uniref:Maltoporin n=1 Tax=Pontiella desulfatans TaxID=2750659 RepID=A0A6C2U429_PONDE|nr:carbohydrate porin [Pontiella desulfatans]VGO14301.1 Maltoporin [Pontiella desulfatans]